MDPGGAFAFNTYDGLYDSSGVLTPLDCSAPNRLSPSPWDLHVIPLSDRGNSEPSALLAAIQRASADPQSPSAADKVHPDNRPLSDIRAPGRVVWHRQSTYVSNPPMR
jgi:hypothetical protein